MARLSCGLSIKNGGKKMTIQNTYNVESYGAIGNGKTDNTTAFQNAINDIESNNGGYLYIPPGDYVIDGSIDLPSNIHIYSQGATLRKTTTAREAYLFTIGRTKGVPGYGGGAKNITISNIIFEGRAVDYNSRRALSLSFHHAQKVVIKDCIFLNCITDSHAIDLAGCDDIHVYRCAFKGAFNITGREYTEAIQIDSSAPTSIVGFTNYDGLPTKNVIVRDCSFTPSYKADNTVLNYAPNPIGNHGFTGGKYYEGIIFDNNLVYDGWQQTGDNWRAWVHFYGLKDSKITNNRFINPRRIKALPIGFYTSSGGRYNPETYVPETGVPLPHKNIEITGNYFEGFTDTSTENGLIDCYGAVYNSTEYRIVNFIVSNNQFTQNIADFDTEKSTVTSLIKFSRFSDIQVSNNKSDLSGRFLSVFNGRNVSATGNITTRVNKEAYLIWNVERINVTNNVGENLRRPINIDASYHVNISDNIFTNIKQTGAENYALRLRNLVGAIIQSNYVQTSANIANGLYIYDTNNTTKDIKAYDNLSVGFTNTITNSGTMVRYKYRD